LKIAEKYINSLDIRSRQVSLNIKIIDVSLTKSDIKNNVFETRLGDTRIINNSGLGLRTGNLDPGNPPAAANVPNIITDGITQGNFINWLEAKITNENAKILASSQFINGENSNVLTSGAASVDDSLSSATIGRPFKNEGFIKVGETVVTGFTRTANEGVVTCTASEGTAGITFGAKVDKIDDNGYVTFAPNVIPAVPSDAVHVTTPSLAVRVNPVTTVSPTFMNPSFLKGLPIVAELNESSTEAAPDVRTFEFSPFINWREARIFAFSLVIFASSQFIKFPWVIPSVIMFGTFAAAGGFPGSRFPVLKPRPLLLIILVSPSLVSNTLFLISDLVKETSIILIFNDTCLLLISREFIYFSAIFK
jgi:hypothetical protein